MEKNECKTCGGSAEGYKCNMCGEEAHAHDPRHKCGGEHCMPKCSGCKESEAKCTC